MQSKDNIGEMEGKIGKVVCWILSICDVQKTHQYEGAAKASLILVTDIDDTTVCAGDSVKGQVAGMDKTCSHGVAYPGNQAFYQAMLTDAMLSDESTQTKKKDSLFRVCSARPKKLDSGFKTAMKFDKWDHSLILDTPKTTKKMIGNTPFREAFTNQIFYGSLFGGTVDQIQNFVSGVESFKNMGHLKYQQMKAMLNKTKGEDKLVFVGDNGQGDLYAAMKLLQDPETSAKVKAIFIHDVRAINGKETLLFGWDPRGQRKDVQMKCDICKKKIIFFQNYAEAAMKSRKFDLVTKGQCEEVVKAFRSDEGCKNVHGEQFCANQEKRMQTMEKLSCK